MGFASECSPPLLLLMRILSGRITGTTHSMIILYILLGAALGLAIGYFAFRSRESGDATIVLRETEMKLAAANAELVESEKLRAVAASQVQQLDAERRELRGELEHERTQLRAHAADLARVNQMLRSSDDNYQKLEQASEEMRTQLREQFENLANRILEEKSDKFTKLNQSQLENILTPLQAKLKDFENKVDTTYRIEAAERNSLRGEILKLSELNKQISDEAANLTRALKGDTKKQGNWGELILEKVLEFSGLRKGDEYVIQESHTSDDGRQQRPDVIVKLPEGKHIIIDSKVSLIAYDRYASAQTDEERAAALAEHISSVRAHIKGLSEKNYPGIATLDTPNFTLLFMPIESSFGLAVQADNDLFAYAWEKKIIIVSPSTLLATLRTIASIWKQEKQTKNAIEIADEAGKMYDKFVGFVEDLNGVGKKLDDAKKSYTDAMGKLHTGTGNLVRRGEKLRELGIKANKQLPPSLLDQAD